MDRPKCKRCGGPLDLWFDVELQRTVLRCNNPSPLSTDAEFQERWDDLPGDDVVRLTRTRPLVSVPDPETEQLAKEVVRKMQTTPPEPIEQWAARLGAELAQFTD